MGSNIIKAESFALAAPVDQIAEIIEANTGGETLGVRDIPKYVNPGGTRTKWELETSDGTETLDEIVGVIAFHKLSRVYWEKSYDESGGDEAPLCRSFDGITGVGEPGGECGPPRRPKCPLAKFGEDGEKPQCRLVKQLFVYTPGKLVPTLLNVTPINIGAASRYLNSLMFDMKKYNHVVTKITASTSKSKNGKDYPEYRFVKVADLDEKQREDMDDYLEMIKPLLMEVEVEAADTQETTDEPW